MAIAQYYMLPLITTVQCDNGGCPRVAQVEASRSLPSAAEPQHAQHDTHGFMQVHLAHFHTMTVLQAKAFVPNWAIAVGLAGIVAGTYWYSMRAVGSDDLEKELKAQQRQSQQQS